MTAESGLELLGGDDTALVGLGATQVSRGQVREQADALLARMAEHSVARVLVCSDNPVHILRSMDACARTGADLYVAHTNLPAETVDELCTSFGIELRIGDEDRLLEPAQRAEARPAPAGRVHMMTSGTTGRPKVAAHTLAALVSRAKAGAGVPANRDGRWLLTYQPTGFAGVQVILTATLARGLIVVPDERTPAGFYAAARRWDVTQISATPTFWRSFMMVVPPEGMALRQITLGGEAADQNTLDRLKKAFVSARITHIYASTEAGVVFAVHDGLEGFPKAWLDRANQSVQLRIVDDLLQIRTPNAMRGYVTDNAQPLDDDGWLRTADRCEIVGERVRVLGRQDSTINVGGSKVYPLMVETFLLSLPEVHEAKVYGVPNPISGFLVGADVVLEAGVDATAARKTILAACREKLAGYQVPRALKFVDALVVGASGKKG